ncbi:hypothetical protein BJ912DRAFT_1103927 [Pholiota molesta]|nr:hypothetical protein BJ912DRAFT_1103927 [Pholiota molesta]
MNDGPDPSNLAESILEPQDNEHTTSHINPPPTSSLLIKLPAWGDMNTRRTSRRLSSVASGSEYHASEKSGDMDEEPDIAPQKEEEPPEELITTKRGRQVRKRVYAESTDNEGAGDDEEGADIPAAELFNPSTRPRFTRGSSKRLTRHISDDDDEGNSPKPFKRSARLNGFIVSDEEEKLHGGGRYPTRTRSKKLMNGTQMSEKEKQKQKEKEQKEKQRADRSQRNARRSARHKVDEDYENVEHTSSGASADADGSLDDAPQSSDLELEPEPEPEPEPEDDNDGKPYALRQRKEINYAIPPPVEEMQKPPPKQAGGRNGGRNGAGGGKGKGRLGWSATGAELGRWMGMPPADDSDSDYPTRTPRKGFGGVVPFGGGAVAGGGMLGGDLAAGGTPSNLGKIGDSVLADADPLGVNQNVTFDEVGGLDDLTILSLDRYSRVEGNDSSSFVIPRVFQRFNVTLPEVSCSTVLLELERPSWRVPWLLAVGPVADKSVRTSSKLPDHVLNSRLNSIFMRKGADCLSKWVGEAERQLRLLFEEARNSQPSIIFFDEIDGLAPVRSSKQDQIHASIVSTLLALMDGMDGRGQVVVMARRTGRTPWILRCGAPAASTGSSTWASWAGGAGEDPEHHDEGDILRFTKQRSIAAKPETIGIGLRDFMISIKKLVPSSARSSSSAATPLPEVGDTAGDAVEKKLTALEEAEFEDEGGEEGALEKEMLSQAMQTLRVYRPRVIIHGPVGMGQGYIVGWCAAITETARSTVRAMLDTLAPTDPILLLAVVDGNFSDLPRDVKAWFGPTKDNRVELTPPSVDQRLAFFEGVLNDVQRPPNKFADGMERRKRILEELPIAPPLEPRKPTQRNWRCRKRMTSGCSRCSSTPWTNFDGAEEEVQEFTKRATEEYNFDPQDNAVMDTVTTTAIEVHRGPNGVLEVRRTSHAIVGWRCAGPSVNGMVMEQQQMMQQPPLYDMDLERMQTIYSKAAISHRKTSSTTSAKWCTTQTLGPTRTSTIA